MKILRTILFVIVTIPSAFFGLILFGFYFLPVVRIFIPQNKVCPLYGFGACGGLEEILFIVGIILGTILGAVIGMKVVDLVFKLFRKKSSPT